MTAPQRKTLFRKGRYDYPGFCDFQPVYCWGKNMLFGLTVNVLITCYWCFFLPYNQTVITKLLVFIPLLLTLFVWIRFFSIFLRNTRIRPKLGSTGQMLALIQGCCRSAHLPQYSHPRPIPIQCHTHTVPLDRKNIKIFRKQNQQPWYVSQHDSSIFIHNLFYKHARLFIDVLDWNWWIDPNRNYPCMTPRTEWIWGFKVRSVLLFSTCSW